MIRSKSFKVFSAACGGQRITLILILKYCKRGQRQASPLSNLTMFPGRVGRAVVELIT